jgi:1,4-dihydroxy-2-naphthoate polyprenyltransferase
MNNIKAYIGATRPNTIPAGVGPILIGFGLSGKGALRDNPLLAVAVAVCAILLQVGANLVNDYFDHKNNIDRADRIGPKRATASGELLPAQVQKAYRICLGLAALIGVYLVIVGGLPILIIGLLTLLFAYIYTGGPYPLSYVGMGEILTFIFFGPVAVWGTYFLLTGNGGLLPVIVGFGPGSIALSIMAINNMRDLASDKIGGKITMAVYFGEKISRFIPIFGVAASVLVPIYLASHYDSKFLLLGSVIWIPFVVTWKRILFGKIDKSQNKSLADTASYLLLYSIVLSIGLLFYS